MKQIIKDLISEIKTTIINDMKGGRNKEIVMLVLDAYNRYQEDERDGVDYIFDLNNKKDLVCCIRGGMTAEDIHDLYNLSLHKTTWFYYGVNHEKPEIINDIVSLAASLAGVLEDFLPYVLAYQNADAYKQLYDKYVSNFIIDNNYNF